MIFHQLFEKESSTYTYLLADEQTREAVMIDPVIETLERDMKLIADLGLKLLFVLDTHIHADHVTAAGELRSRLGAKTGVSHLAKVDCVDLLLREGQEILFGRYRLRVIETPGHTDSCLCFYIEGRLFSGDTLLIRGTGRTDFQQGSSQKLFENVRKKLFALPPETEVYPGHDYKGFTHSTIETEMKLNPRVGLSVTYPEFEEIMKNLNLAHPKKIDIAVPANLACGKTK